MAKLSISVHVNEAWLLRDLNVVLATTPKLTIEQAIQTLPIGKYLRVDGRVEAGQEGRQGDADRAAAVGG
jgi:hypothetical protein